MSTSSLHHMSTSSVHQKSSRSEKKTVLKRGLPIHYQDVVASLSLAALSSTVLALVYESMIP